MKRVRVLSDSLFHDIHRYFEYVAPRSSEVKELLARMGTGWLDDIQEANRKYGDESQTADMIINTRYMVLRRNSE